MSGAREGQGDVERAEKTGTGDNAKDVAGSGLVR